MQLTKKTDSVTMNSVDIAKAVGKKHHNVLADIRFMMKELNLVALEFQGYYKASNGKSNPCFDLPEDLVMTLLTGYSIPLRKACLDELNRLRQKNTIKLPQNYDEALEHLLEQRKEVGLLTEVIEEQRPAVEFAHTISCSEDAVNIETFAKATHHSIGLGRNSMFAHLRRLGYLMKNNMPYQIYIEQGLFRVREVYVKAKDEIMPQTLITGRGQSIVSERLKQKALV